MLDVITLPTKLPYKLEHGWLITSHAFMVMQWGGGGGGGGGGLAVDIWQFVCLFDQNLYNTWSRDMFVHGNLIVLIFSFRIIIKRDCLITNLFSDYNKGFIMHRKASQISISNSVVTFIEAFMMSL